MIQSFGNNLAEDLFNDKDTKATRSLSPNLRSAAIRKLQYLNAAALIADLRVPPGNRLEALKGDLKGCHSIRINDQWRVVFQWSDGHAKNVKVLDYH